MRFRLAAFIAVLAGAACATSGAINYLDQVTGANATGSYASTGSTVCLDDFEINGVAGPGGGFVSLSGVQAVFSSPTGEIPTLFRVNIYHNTNDPAFGNLRTLAQGDVFTNLFDSSTPGLTIQPFPIPGETGNFPGAYLVTIPFNVNVSFGAYYLSVVASGNPGSQFFVSGSDTVTEGTPNDLVRVTNQGFGGVAQVVADNAAYRVMGVPTPGGASVLVLAGLAAARRRRR